MALARFETLLRSLATLPTCRPALSLLAVQFPGPGVQRKGKTEVAAQGVNLGLVVARIQNGRSHGR